MTRPAILLFACACACAGDDRPPEPDAPVMRSTLPCGHRLTTTRREGETAREQAGRHAETVYDHMDTGYQN